MAPAVLALLLPVLQVADMSRIVDLQEPAISPDAGRIAIVEISQNLARATDENRLLLVNARTGAIRVLVRGGDVAVPRWSPDGRRLTYLATVRPSGIRQLFLREPDGRTRRLTQASGDVIDDAWSPDGTRIAYVAADPQPHSTYFFAGDNDYTATALTPPDHLWVVPAGGGRSRRLTSGSWTIAPTDPGGIFSPQISLDARRPRDRVRARREYVQRGRRVFHDLAGSARGGNRAQTHRAPRRRTRAGLLARRRKPGLLVRARRRLHRGKHGPAALRQRRPSPRGGFRSQRLGLALVSGRAAHAALRG